MDVYATRLLELIELRIFSLAAFTRDLIPKNSWIGRFESSKTFYIQFVDKLINFCCDVFLIALKTCDKW